MPDTFRDLLTFKSEFDMMVSICHQMWQMEEPLEHIEMSARNALTIRPPAELHGLLTQAASWLGVSLNSLVLEAAADRAREVMETQRQIKLSRADSERFFTSLHKPAKPNAALKRAAKAHRELIRE